MRNLLQRRSQTLGKETIVELGSLGGLCGFARDKNRSWRIAWQRTRFGAWQGRCTLVIAADKLDDSIHRVLITAIVCDSQHDAILDTRCLKLMLDH